MIPNPYPGTFIVFEGIDGCGKSKQKDLAFISLQGSNPELGFGLTKEPGKERFWGKRIYEDLFSGPDGLHQRDPETLQKWYACDSKEGLRNFIIPNLKEGRLVLCDRYRLSMCYGAQDPGHIVGLLGMNERILGEDFIWPDAALIFDLEIETAMNRLREKGRSLDGFETTKNLERVRRNYRHFANRYPNCHLIDANRPAEEISEDVIKIIQKIIKIKKGGRTPWDLHR